jgi:transcription initiation factor TFIIIB Brf1 subunit/transcription initiation factor TFIIB
VQAINNTESREGTKFTNAWLSSGEAQNSNAKLYGRLAAGGSFLQGTHLGPKTEMAGKFASIVGSAGPQAEMVIGPTARKTAYRYRGTEKTPERRMGRAYAQGVAQGKVYGEPSVEQLALEAQGGRIREPRRAGQPTAAPAPGQIAQEKGRREDRAPTWRERELGRRAVVDHLRAKMPKKNLYELQLASGTTPPSEGVIINADGQLVTQAIGYGDDHYLPFNLKNLKGLKGGEYIRTRSVGGLTSEDIYTALMMGARQVTVTSRSGTYTMEFQEDFRGGRRHNDKARRMTRRYEQLLDAVQSQQVDRIDIDPEMRLEIEREVKEEMAGPTYRRADIQEAIRDRVDEFKENPYITEQDEKRAEAIINSRAAGAGDAERAKIRSQVYDDLMDQKETKFRLNSAGYKAALDALREQFPYYIAEPKWTPPKDQDKKIDTEQDYGYVEPGHNRPTAAAAGLFGAKNRGKFVGSGGKYSASEADYQGARKVGAGRLEQVEEGAAGGKDAHDKRRKAIAEGKLDEQVLDVAQELQKHAKANLDEKSLADPKVAAAVGMTRDELADKNNRSKFSDWAEQYTGLSGFKDLALKRKWESAVGHRERKPYDKGNIGLYPKFPPTFDEPAYELGAKPEVVAREIHRIDSKAKASVISGKIPLSGLSDDEQEKEWRALKQMHETLKADPTPLNTADLTAIGVDLHSPAVSHKLKTDPKAVEQQIEYLQRSRALTHGLTDEHRKTIIENRSKQVVTNETPSSEEQAKARENVKTQIAWGNKVVSEVETLRAQIEAKLKESGLNTGHRESLINILKEFPDERQMDQAQDAIAVMDGLQDQVRSKDDLGHLLQSGELKDDYKALMDASGLLESKREHIGILLNPPKKP